MAKLEILYKRETGGECLCSIRLEQLVVKQRCDQLHSARQNIGDWFAAHHVSNRSTWNDITTNEFNDEID